jgi:hypothetical protein
VSLATTQALQNHRPTFRVTWDNTHGRIRPPSPRWRLLERQAGKAPRSPHRVKVSRSPTAHARFLDGDCFHPSWHYHRALYKGAKSREAPQQPQARGTGPYRFVLLHARRLSSRPRSIRTIHGANRPFFRHPEEVKGGGERCPRARAVLRPGEYDYASEVGGVEDDVLQRARSRAGRRWPSGFGGTDHPCSS